MFKKVTWLSIIVLAVFGFSALSIGFVQALQVTTGGSEVVAGKIDETEPALVQKAAKESQNSIKIVIMGDSIAYGTGDEKGRGFFTYLPDYLKNRTSKEISVDNIGINGLRTAGLRDELQNEKMSGLLAAAAVILVSIGGNDLRSLRTQSETAKPAAFANLEKEYLGNLKEVFSSIRKSSTDAYIVFVGLYNPYEELAGSLDTKLLNTWNYDTQQIVEADAKALFIPTYDVFKFNLAKFVAPDGLHPNSQGYQTISSRIVKSMEGIVEKEN